VKVSIYPSIISYFYSNEYKCAKFWWESPKERDHSEDQGVGGKMGSEWILGRLAWRVWIGFDWLSIGTGDRLCGEEPSSSCATELFLCRLVGWLACLFVGWVVVWLVVGCWLLV
jgi:hypothetical protein